MIPLIVMFAALINGFGELVFGDGLKPALPDLLIAALAFRCVQLEAQRDTARTTPVAIGPQQEQLP
ncbi:hypothetical protein AB0F88_16695 [Streptosporangium sp. NPDC023963]|uniref:hypothetical protein n=1 Tax=Streptosporangium sp. NPDC023963 TaxID=3155608 RepID=UPI003416B3BF